MQWVFGNFLFVNAFLCIFSSPFFQDNRAKDIYMNNSDGERDKKNATIVIEIFENLREYGMFFCCCRRPLIRAHCARGMFQFCPAKSINCRRIQRTKIIKRHSTQNEKKIDKYHKKGNRCQQTLPQSFFPFILLVGLCWCSRAAPLATAFGAFFCWPRAPNIFKYFVISVIAYWYEKMANGFYMLHLLSVDISQCSAQPGKWITGYSSPAKPIHQFTVHRWVNDIPLNWFNPPNVHLKPFVLIIFTFDCVSDFLFFPISAIPSIFYIGSLPVFLSLLYCYAKRYKIDKERLRIQVV